ncbi:family 78 glycoside hydrolase catalytic domain [Murimonas intestini]|uniref:alpha-L-rhamnosidase n=1 Tax=Murimonas intestini TaxID=1337051 RepID=A0AB73T605_9FIRM|nr:family 78 glycoside hydrolase catalytic domain [Murimonas intestini]MCR1841923.1 glycoside hydrolase family 78 protein [Murimonas intestini]MCR1864993.1 glycoside hydrolase family 78 protein [Murimonas intestini]MCR1885690.1 glycoside hydrolase family 78 protein [Murimonas intestini]
MRAINLKTEHLKNPLGIDSRPPYLSWNCLDGIKQTAYEIQAESEGRILWNSGKTAGSKMNVLFGAEVKSRQRILWKVRLWDEDDRIGEWSTPAFFEMGILDKEEFAAKWINPELECDPKIHKPASYLKKIFEAPKTDCARLYVTSHGLYEVWLNGERAGDFVLAPGSSTYDRSLAYQTYDVTELLKEGENEVQVILGDGWYRSCSGVDGDRNLYGEDIGLYFQLEADGKPICVSDETWLASQHGPLRENDMQQGEVYDATIEEITDYHPVRTADFGTDNFVCSNSLAVREKERFPGKIIQTPNGDTVIDYGQNLAGYVEFSLTAHAGDKIVLIHGETLDENGNFTTENFQDRKRHKEGGTEQKVTYICREGENYYKSRFTIWGFRYAKVVTDIDLRGAEFTSIAVYSDMEQLGSFECSDQRVNQLVRNSVWSLKSNFCDVPTDCPTRERAAWTGDMGVFAGTGIFLADCYPVIRKWLGECRLNQYEDGKVANIAPKNNVPGFFSGMLAGSVGWGDACIIVPYTLYQRYGDRRILEENYEMMKKWYRFLEGRAKQKPLNPIKRLKKNPYRDYTIETGVDYGEWCEPDVESTMAMRTPQGKVATAYFSYSGRLLADIAQILGHEDEADHYRNTAEKAKEAFRFIATEDGKIKSDRQADYVRAISFDLLNEKEKSQAAAELNQLVIRNDYHLNTGFLSTPSLCPVLAEYGYLETAYRLLLQDTMPGWLYAVKKGATTIWENWDGINEKGEVKNSLNHYSYGAVCGWLFEGVCGIHLQDNHITIQPVPGKTLQYAKAVYKSPVGEIISGWKYEQDMVVYEIQIPPNTEAKLILPDKEEQMLTAGLNTIRKLIN